MEPEKPAPPKPCCAELRRRIVFQVALGVVIGFFLAGLGIATWFIVKEYVLNPDEAEALNPGASNDSLPMDDVLHDALQQADSSWTSPEVQDVLYLRKPLYIGVMSLEPYLDSRGVACNQTWGTSKLISKLEFFSHLSEGTPTPIPVINLHEVPADDHWHTHKSFSMLEYICHHHLQQYDWFVRSVDDAYIHAAKLRHFLASHNHRQKLMFGHPTSPVDDASYQLLGGRGYCLGGPGIVLSQPLVAELCPHLPKCRHEFTRVRSEVALAKCISTYTNVECSDNTELLDLFYHTFERNPLSVLERVSRQTQAISVHPLKAPWLMNTHHQHVTQTLIQKGKQLLRDLENEKQSLVAHLSMKGHNETTLTLRKPQENDAIVFDEFLYHPKQCNSAQKISPPQKAEIEEAVLLAKTSSRIGDLLDCFSLIGGQIQHDMNNGTTITTQFLCKNTQNPSEYKVTEVTMKKALAPPTIKKDRRRDLSSRVAVLIHSNYADSQLLDLLLNLKHITNHVSFELIVYIILTPGLEPIYQRKMSTNSYDTVDIENWYKDHNLQVKSYKFDNGTNLTRAYADIIKGISRNYTDATVLLTETDVSYDVGFFKRCRAVVRPGKQVYHSYPRRTVFTEGYLMYGQKQQVIETMWTGHPRPTCVHISDLKGHRGNRKKQAKHAALRNKNIKVTSALDIGLSVIY